MKNCPACNFTFPDFHHVCDFDGTELVTIPEKTPAKPGQLSSLRHRVKSRFFLLIVSALALMSSAILFGYYGSLPRSPRTAATEKAVAARNVPGADNASREADADKTSVAVNKETTIYAPPRSRRTVNPRFSTTARNRAAPGRSDRTNPHRPAIAKTREENRVGEKDPRLVAIFKSTWRVLRKPFRL